MTGQPATTKALGTGHNQDSAGQKAPFLVTAGGTGGHLFPAVALGMALIKRGHAVGLVTDRRGKAFSAMIEGDFADTPTYRIDAASPSGNLFNKVTGAISLMRGFFQAKKLMRSVRPRAVIGFGGYASVPSCMAARHAGVPVILHEQNAVMGRANRLVAQRAKMIFTSFPKTAGLQPQCQSQFVGNPVRAPFLQAAAQAYPPITESGILRLLVVGGSQGARIFADILPGAIAKLPAALQQRLHITQQTREEDMERCQAAYDALSIKADLSPFIGAMAQQMAQAHLLICRCGASTLSEVTAVGRPAILVPYPYAMDNHQEANAQALASAEGGWLMVQKGWEKEASEIFTVEALAEKLFSLLSNPEKLGQAAVASQQFAQINAADQMAKTLESLFSEA